MVVDTDLLLIFTCACTGYVGQRSYCFSGVRIFVCLSSEKLENLLL